MDIVQKPSYSEQKKFLEGIMSSKKCPTFRDTTPYSLLKVNLLFWETCCFHLQYRRVRQTWMQHKSGSEKAKHIACKHVRLYGSIVGCYWPPNTRILFHMEKLANFTRHSSSWIVNSRSSGWKFSTCYETWTFITMFTGGHCWSLSWVGWC
jgi:hypothetical protein